MAAPSLPPRRWRWRRGTRLHRILVSAYRAHLGELCGWRRQSTATRVSEPEWLGTSYFAPSKPSGAALGHLELDADGLGGCCPHGFPVNKERRQGALLLPPALGQQGALPRPPALRQQGASMRPSAGTPARHTALT